MLSKVKQPYSEEIHDFLRKEYSLHWKKQEYAKNDIESEVISATPDGRKIVVVWNVNEQYHAHGIDYYRQKSKAEIFLEWIQEVKISWL